MHGNGYRVSGILGRTDGCRDPLWGVEFRLTPVERALLRTWELRRLQFIAHAGGAAVTTTQTYTRLEHSLGLLALVVHFAPDDHAARVAALLHDVGHLPFSHTFEGVAGLHHHELGRKRVRGLTQLLADHGLDVEEVLAVEEPGSTSVLRPVGGLKLDHLESFVRSGRVHGRLTEAPARTLAKLRLVDGAVHTDAETGGYLAELAYGEASYMCGYENIVANAALTAMVETLLAGGLDSAELADFTDDELWAALLAEPTTAAMARLLRRDPLAWEMLPVDHPEAGQGFAYQLRKLYLDTPFVDGEPIGVPSERMAELPQMPLRCVVLPRELRKAS
ncbi:HD domain-containing protein [Nocardia stercoris]|uniref:HD domain-containing protein n=2 Tax=Nocardia stercoris TaxID=2483361 RepID=A0A3M2KVZ9_9NOCA|nr:HD domain-containing protein [Nocardia stercoris]